MDNFPDTAPVRQAEVFVFRAPIDHPVRTSFGIMHDRPAVIMRLEDEDGYHGWGEVWCNFPSCGAEHRGRLLAETVLPHVIGKEWRLPNNIIHGIREKLHILRLQCDEPGPFDQVLAGVDNALWDLAARRAEVPLHMLLGNAAMTEMPAYASGINHPGISETMARSRNEGYRAFKIKIGFGVEQDKKNIETALSCLLPDERLAVDVNQAWNMERAFSELPLLQQYPLMWVEEPIPCDSRNEDWGKLATLTKIPLSAGENIRSRSGFRVAIQEKAIKVIQPDICKWGGLTRCREVAIQALENSLTYCPHYLGGGIGLLASAHLLAAAGGPGMLEIDCNPNPLRNMLATPFPKIRDGKFILSAESGTGVEPDLDAAGNFITYHNEIIVD